MEPLRRDPNAIVLVSASPRPMRRSQSALVWRALGLLPAAVATPRRALFTAGVALGLASPPVLRFLARRALGSALGALWSAGPKGSDEMTLQRFTAIRIVLRRRR